MKLHAPFVQLPLLFDAAGLAAEIAQFPESAWRPHPQGYAGNSMLPLVAVNGDPANEMFAGAMKPTPALERCPKLRQVLAAVGATVGRTRLMRLAGMAEVKRHVDQGYYWAERVRIHVPIVTQPTVRFECGDDVVNMAAGECWIFDTWRQHRVHNDATASRVHLVIDTVGGEAFWNLVDRGRIPGVSAEGWQAQTVEWRDTPAPFALETRNIPRVMTPWELGKHLNFLLGEALPHPQLDVVRGHVARLLRQWAGLWAAHGDAPETAPRFREAFDRFVATVQPLTQDLALANETRWIDGVMLMLGRSVVPPSRPPAMPPRAMA
ncbi:aspartyl/asparaginyl beta-hydroxylase domain-containing protein [Lysobacter xanthus]